MDAAGRKASRQKRSERVGHWQRIGPSRLEELRCECRGRQELALQVELIHRAQTQTCQATSRHRTPLAVKDGKSKPHLSPWQYAVRELRLPKQARAEIGKFVVPNVE